MLTTSAQRKTRCDPGLPRCTPCERNNAVCEYWDPAKKCNINRNYVVWLQQRVNDLEKEIDRLETQDITEDPELMIRNAAAVRVQDADESKFLGPSSGTQITRLVMQLAKQFTDSKTIKEIVPDARARQVQELYNLEADKPTSKVYPLISSVAAEELPNRDLISLLYQLYCLKVQPMYPALHEPTLWADMEAAQNGSTDPYQNFITRMVIAISLQKMDSQYAGLADSYYLAALKYMEAVVRRMDLKTLQAFALIAEYSLLTPTRTAIYYICGLAVRLVQALGIHEEESITRAEGGGLADPLEIDMRRRIFWCIFTMEAGLSHALGRPMSLASGRQHLDVKFFELCDDSFITRQGVQPGAPNILKKWIAMHFFKMRLLQLEVRRKLYLNKRPTPKDDQDPWFKEFMVRLDAWRDASPETDAGTGLNKVWFIGRYNTIIAFLYRPCPQIPRPSLQSAIKCFDAAKYNIYMVREQIRVRNVDLTWIFTQALFMAINTMLWSLSYEEVRKQNPKAEVEKHLQTSMESVLLAADRWPGVASAHALYIHIIDAILKIYDKDGDVPISATSPSSAASPGANSSDGVSRSRTNSPAVFAAAPSSNASDSSGPSAHFQQRAQRNLNHIPTTLAQQVNASPPVLSPSSTLPTSTPSTYTIQNSTSPESLHSQPMVTNGKSLHQSMSSGSSPSQFQPLPDNFADMAMSGVWPQNFTRPGPSVTPYDPYSMPDQAFSQTSAADAFAPMVQDFALGSNPSLQQAANSYLDPNYWNASVNTMPGFGLNADQQMELMQNLETSGMEDIEMMIAGANMIWNPGQNRPT